MTKQHLSYNVKIVGHKEKVWESPEGGTIMRFFSSEKGDYEMVRVEKYWQLTKTYVNGDREAIMLSKPAYNTLLKGNRVIIDEDILSL